MGRGCGGDAEPGGRVRHQASHSHPCRASAPRLIRGFILRHEPRCPQNAFFLDHVRTSFLLNLRRQLPRNILDPSWPTPPPALREVCGPSLLTREPPTPSAEGLDNHVTRGASGREGKGPGAGLRGTTREWRGGPGRGGVASACRLPGLGGEPGCLAALTSLVPPGLGAPAGALPEEHGVEVLPEHQPRVEAAGTGEGTLGTSQGPLETCQPGGPLLGFTM